MKLFASLIATAALTLSVLVGVPSTATAAPYPGTVATQSQAVGAKTVKRTKAYRVAYKVKAKGNAKPSGKVIIRVYRLVKGKYKAIRSYTKAYSGSGYKFTSLGKYKKGKYAFRVYFRPAKSSVYKASNTGLRTFRVR